VSLRPRTNVCLLILLCVALLVARVSGAHLHLCFDGTEPFASVHMLDSGPAAASDGLTAAHHDEEVFVIGDVVNKSAKVGLELPALLAFVLLLWAALQLPRLVAPGFRPLLAAAELRVLLPPPRAPPRR
jgi:hypothetical protein